MSKPSTPSTARIRPLLLALLVTVSVIGIGAGSVAAQDTTQQSAVTVDLQETGTADVTIRLTYDLSTAEEEAAFESFQTDEQLLTELETRFADRMDSVANATADRTGRDVTVSDIQVTFDVVDSTGVIELTATMQNLASVEGEQVRLTEPFSSGFQTDRIVQVSVPDGYEATAVSPAPDTRSDGTLTWAADSTFEDFEVVATADSASGTTDTSVPGMGILAGAVAIVGVSLALRSRQRL